MKKILALIFAVWILLLLQGCGLKGGAGSGLKFKKVTPRMEKQLVTLIRKGCRREYKTLDRNLAVFYSIFPGGGQFYTGETKKGFIYILSFPLIFPYFVSFTDAQNSVDYYNFRYTIHTCRKKLRIPQVYDHLEIVIQKQR